MRVALELLAKLGLGRQPTVVGLGHDPFELVAVDHGGEVEDGARWAGEREAVAAAKVARVEVSAVDLDPGPSGVPLRRHGDPQTGAAAG
jgi:hypothetical protein